MLVSASFYPIEILARRVGGDLIEVYNPVPPGVEPHDLELTPRAIERIQQSRVFLYLGRGFQPAIDRALDTIKNEQTIDKDVSVGIDLMPASPDEGEHVEEGNDAAYDQHIWLDPLLAQAMTSNIAEALSQADPQHQAAYNANAEKLRSELAALDEEYKVGFKSCARKEIITSHAAFGYLTRRYGLEQLAVSGLSPETEPSPARMQEVINLAKERDAKYIFFETLADPRVAQVIAEGAGAQTLVLNPIEGLTEEQVKEGKDYFSLMRENLSNLKLALDCQ
jgi:zinc transport system substrate-binding protein